MRVPNSGLPPHIAELVRRIDDKLIDHVPKIEKLHGSDTKIGNTTIGGIGRIALNLGEMSWQRKKDLAEDIFIASLEIVCWSKEEATC